MGFLSDAWDDIKDFGQDVIDSVTGKDTQRAIENATNAQNANLDKILELLQPGLDFQQSQYPLLQQNATIEGYGDRLNSILSNESFQPFLNTVVDKTKSSLANAGARLSGAAPRAISDSLLNAAMGIEGNLAGRTQTNAGLSSGATSAFGNILQQQGNNVFNSILGQNQAQQAGMSNLLNLGGGILTGATGGGGMLGGLLGGLGSLFGLSDERLKKNIRVVGRKDNLDLIKWDWNDKAARLYGLEGEGLGVSANQVKRLYPEHVTSNDDGFLMVDYLGLSKEVA